MHLIALATWLNKYVPIVSDERADPMRLSLSLCQAFDDAIAELDTLNEDSYKGKIPTRRR